MPLTITQGQTAQLQFAADRVGLDPAAVASVSWQPQGSQQAVHFIPPDQLEGRQPGMSSFKVTATMTAVGEKMTWPFDVLCVAASPGGFEPVVPVVLYTATAPATAP
jgi:hypothetical protein